MVLLCIFTQNFVQIGQPVAFFN